MKKKAQEIIIDCLTEKGMTQTQLAASLGEDRRSINQQLKKRNDMKVERFVDVLEHMGYRVEIVENDDIRKVSAEYADRIVTEREPRGLFWYFDGNVYVGIDNTDGEAYCEEFSSKEDCFEWLK